MGVDDHYRIHSCSISILISLFSVSRSQFWSTALRLRMRIRALLVTIATVETYSYRDCKSIDIPGTVEIIEAADTRK